LTCLTPNFQCGSQLVNNQISEASAERGPIWNLYEWDYNFTQSFAPMLFSAPHPMPLNGSGKPPSSTLPSWSLRTTAQDQPTPRSRNQTPRWSHKATAGVRSMGRPSGPLLSRDDHVPPLTSHRGPCLERSVRSPTSRRSGNASKLSARSAQIWKPPSTRRVDAAWKLWRLLLLEEDGAWQTIQGRNDTPMS
jgi:hypothetical protein